MDGQLMHVLRQANMALRAALRQALDELELTPVQSTVLHLIADTPGSSSAELARRTHVTPQSMHRLVSDLGHRGLLLLRPRSGHGRTLDAHLTDEGRRLLAEADNRAQAIEEHMTTGLDEQQRHLLLDLLQHCVTALDTTPEAPASP